MKMKLATPHGVLDPRRLARSKAQAQKFVNDSHASATVCVACCQLGPSQWGFG